MNIPPGFAQVFPYIFAANAAEYIQFLKDGLGAQEVGRTVDPNGRIANCSLRFGEATFMVSESSDDYPPSRAALYLYVEDADQAMARAIEQGAILEMDVADMPYGDRQGGIVDPAGNIWWISQRLSARPYTD